MNYAFKIMVVVLVFAVLQGCQTTSNLNNQFYEPAFYYNCPVPNGSITIKEENGEEFKRFKLKNMQKGGCSTDRRPRHSAPYWERAELKQSGYLHRNSVYQIKFKARFIKGFQGSKENFFQIHQSVRGCFVYPVIMTKFSSGTIFGLWMFAVSDYYGEWIDFNFNIDLINQKYSIKINDKLFLENEPFRKPLVGCGLPHIKYGIYRPGNDVIPNNQSIVDFKNWKIKKITLQKNDPYNLGSLSSTMICYRHGLYDGRYIKEAKRRGLNCE
jgi:hypothetical protein